VQSFFNRRRPSKNVREQYFDWLDSTRHTQSTQAYNEIMPSAINRVENLKLHVRPGFNLPLMFDAFHRYCADYGDAPNLGPH